MVPLPVQLGCAENFTSTPETLCRVGAEVGSEAILLVESGTLGQVLGEYSDTRLVVRFERRMDGSEQVRFWVVVELMGRLEHSGTHFVRVFLWGGCWAEPPNSSMHMVELQNAAPLQVFGISIFPR